MVAGEARGANLMDSLLADIGHGLRLLRRNPTFTALGDAFEDAGIYLRAGSHALNAQLAV